MIIKEKQLTLNSLEVKEVILEVIPQKEGEIVIEGITWELFEVVSCSIFFPTNCPNELRTNENTAKRLAKKEQMFHYFITPQSVDLKVEVDEKIRNKFLLSEFTSIDSNFINDSDYTVKDVYAVCSHPILFGFKNQKLFDVIKPRSAMKH